MVPCFTNCPSELGELSGLEVSPFGSWQNLTQRNVGVCGPLETKNKRSACDELISFGCIRCNGLEIKELDVFYFVWHFLKIMYICICNFSRLVNWKWHDLSIRSWMEYLRDLSTKHLANIWPTVLLRLLWSDLHCKKRLFAFLFFKTIGRYLKSFGQHQTFFVENICLYNMFYITIINYGIIYHHLNHQHYNYNL